MMLMVAGNLGGETPVVTASSTVAASVLQAGMVCRLISFSFEFPLSRS